MTQSSWTIDILNRSEKRNVHIPRVKRLLWACLQDRWEHDGGPYIGSKEHRTVRSLSVVFTHDEDIRSLNRDYRGKDQPTDVLSFSLLERKSEDNTDSKYTPESLGDIVISLDTAERQAYEAGISREEEIARLLIHGLLHLLGFEHEDVSDSEAATFFRVQEELLLKFQFHLLSD